MPARMALPAASRSLGFDADVGAAGVLQQVHLFDLQVEETLDAAHHRVVDFAVVAQRDQRLPLHVDQFALEPAQRAASCAAASVPSSTSPSYSDHRRLNRRRNTSHTSLGAARLRPSSSSRWSAAFAVAASAIRSSRAVRAVVAHAQAPDQPRQRSALTDQRREEHAERQEHDQVAVRERVRVGRDRDRERGGERDAAAHARPREDEHVRPVRLAFFVLGSFVSGKSP